jgi:hypothetical protein
MKPNHPRSARSAAPHKDSAGLAGLARRVHGAEGIALGALNI